MHPERGRQQRGQDIHAPARAAKTALPCGGAAGTSGSRQGTPSLRRSHRQTAALPRGRFERTCQAPGLETKASRAGGGGGHRRMAVFDYTRAWREEVAAAFPPLRRAVNSISEATSVLPGTDTAVTAVDAADRRTQLLLNAAADLAVAQRCCRQLWATLAQTAASLGALAAWLSGPGDELLRPEGDNANDNRGRGAAGRRPTRRRAGEPRTVSTTSLQAALSANADAIASTARLAVHAAQEACDVVAGCLPSPLLLALGLQLPKQAAADWPWDGSSHAGTTATEADGAHPRARAAAVPPTRPDSSTGTHRSRGGGAAVANTFPVRRTIEADLAAAAAAGAMTAAAAATPGAAELLDAVPSEAELLCLLDSLRLLPLFAAAAAGAGRPDAGRAVPWAGGGGTAFDQACGAVSSIRETAVRQLASRAGADGQAAVVPPLHGLLALRPGEDAFVSRC